MTPLGGNLGVSLQAEVDGEVIGYRIWRIKDGELSSIMRGDIWPKEPWKADCQRYKHVWPYGNPVPPAGGKCHVVPGRHCQCGFNAHHEVGPAFDRWYKFGGKCVLGAMRGWGQFEVHHDGFRAEWAQPVALCRGDTDGLEQTAKDYGIPLVQLSELETVAHEYGQVIPAELLPDPPPVNGDYAAIMGQALQSKTVGQMKWAL